MSSFWLKIIHSSYYNAAKQNHILIKSAATACAAGGALVVYSTFTSNKHAQTESSPLAAAAAALRFIRSLRIGLTISIDYWLNQRILNPESEDYEKCMSIVHSRNANRILHGCMINGGTYIKIGQGLVSLSHILPREYITTLQWLQDKCLVRKGDEVEQIFMAEFGKSPDDMFKSFQHEPIAAASLAQVFVATTKNDEKVAVKVQYKDLQERFSNDVSTIEFLLRLAAYFHPTFDFTWILQDLTENLRNELDFKKEGQNAEKCAGDLAHLSYIYIPKVYWDLCSKRVLVTEFIDAIKISENEALIQRGHSLADIDKKMFTAFGEQIFQIGFVHADPHPGNVFVRKFNNETQLVLLDHGLYQQLGEDERIGLSNFWQAIVIRDRIKMDKYSKALGVQNYAEFAEVLTQTPMKKEFRLVTRLTQTDIDYISEVAQHRLDIITKTLKEMPRSLLFVIRNLNTLRAIAHDHGNPVNRYRILARIATKTAFKNEDSFWMKVRSIPLRISFEYQLFLQRSWLAFMKWYFKFLEMIGRAPDTSAILALMY